MGIFFDLIEAIKGYRDSRGWDELTVLNLDRKAMPFMSARGYGGYSGEYLTTLNDPVEIAIGRYRGSSINYQREAGDPMCSSLVAPAVQWFGTVLPEAPFIVREMQGEKEQTVDHPALELLATPNDYYSGETLLFAFALSWIVDGNCYWIKERNMRGKVISLWYEPHFTIRCIMSEDGKRFISDYEILRDGQWLTLESLGLGRTVNGQWQPDVIHFRKGINPNNPCYGMSPLASVYREIVTDNEAANFSALLMKNCGVPPLLIRPKDSAKGLNKQQLDEMEERIQKKLRGDQRGKALFVSNAVDVSMLSFNNEQLDLSSVRSIPETRVAAAIGIPGQVLGYKEHLHNNTFSNYKEAREAAYEGYVIPTQRLIAGTLKKSLLDDFDGTPNTKRKIEFDLTKVRILQDDEDKKAERVARLYEAGLWKRSEGRAATGQKWDATDEVYISDVSKSAAGDFVNALANDAPEM